MNGNGQRGLKARVLGISILLAGNALIGASSLYVHLRLNQQVYRNTSYSEPPQIAVWLESVGDRRRETLWITRRMAQNRWDGKLFCPGALPIWESLFKHRWPIIRGRRQMPDAITAATPLDRIHFEKKLPDDGEWILRIEVNVSGDYNQAFSYRDLDGTPDMEGIGQPSLLFEGRITGRGRVDIVPRGRSERWIVDGKIVSDLSGLDSALHIFEEVKGEVR